MKEAYIISNTGRQGKGPPGKIRGTSQAAYTAQASPVSKCPDTLGKARWDQKLGEEAVSKNSPWDSGAMFASAELVCIGFPR